MIRNVCVITGTRADYGLLRWVMQGIKDDDELNLQVVATGMHLSPEFGLTYRDIEQDGFFIDRRVEMLTSSDTSVGIAKSMGLGMIGFADALDELQPDLIVVLGDRFEIFAAVAAALVARIPVAHLHGGETTEGAFDEALRHSITKMSHIHFVAAEEYRRRVIQLGEQPAHVFTVGGLGIDNIHRMKLLDLDELEASLDFKLGPKSLLITFHPVTLDTFGAAEQMTELLAALHEQRDTNLVFTMPNADNDGRMLINMVGAFVAQHANARAYTSLGQLRYLSCIKHVDGVVGNSSSGLLEVPSFRKGTINIGDRQRGRLQAGSVINCQPDRRSIAAALNELYSTDFQNALQQVDNPYGDGGASEKVVKTIKHFDMDGIAKKAFYNLQQAGPGSKQ
ncbi:MAG: UDP-N-acetylglucosamine 2-epimerase (hydrolyzing) [Zetaproteobacteria bacterium CG06_land_8_20_14_3_00_59_53]|nr:MAG: UDP-N-acetyl-D-glucosamine 2-epimerase, UDP-hydrolysing [Zetaproteobacteria bacterium CG2_30_59_37]PIO89953.1 MAG: UDP-N-acetylglucosamine 2-epimerase (hydrolyzing) [Zetaproteobacteria bacterium CG23_combo_of_CG06-09_8_20_14_all_59_86]PIQ64401.1 MAG: UDP-N-acetylglucosamine 2-epimerase (hydrolyzing) [Zetaproteobacteria bacterium CG11_big_fil_rev_8_21_14_0_20_59_439]PIU70482.1 MAG: UDP-N-acetylglucosamine 2-epimerase (hydrolyzing) [Zetaproteobacteria bacterium CG06_land_8_20_14_3_00_59_53